MAELNGVPDAAQAEAESVAELTIAWAGLYVVVPASLDDWDPDALEAFENGKAINAIRGLLGSKAYDALRSDFAKAKGRKPKVGDLGALLEAIAVAYGFDTIAQ